MPKAKHSDAIARQWEILNIIPRREPGKTTTEIVSLLEGNGFSVTKRTIERDLNELTIQFGIRCIDDAKPYRWLWMPGKGADLPALTLNDALSLKVVEEIVRPLLPKAMLDSLEHRFFEANNKLVGLSGKSKNAGWLDKVRNVQPALSLLPPTINESVLDGVQTALLNDKQIEIDYQTANQANKSNQTLHPLALVQRGPTTYLVATAFGYSDIRMYAVHRMQEITVLSKKITRPKDFSIDEYIAKGALNFGSCKKIKLVAFVSSWLCNILEETPISNDQTIKYGDERPKLSATVEDTWQLRWWILSQSDGIEICKPKKLRAEIEKNLQNALNQYRGD